MFKQTKSAHYDLVLIRFLVENSKLRENINVEKTNHATFDIGTSQNYILVK